MVSGSKTLSNRSNKRIIEKKFIEQVLSKEANNMRLAQDEIFNSRNIPDVIRSARSFFVSGNKLTHKHDIRQRFDDMKRVRFRSQKPTKAHNKVIWGHFNTIIFKLAYGFTEDVKNEIANNYNIEL